MRQGLSPHTYLEFAGFGARAGWFRFAIRHSHFPFGFRTSGGLYAPLAAELRISQAAEGFARALDHHPPVIATAGRP
ncbi:hypothetical protein [Streptomyces sp. NEAU-S7GS2]|uniref:hypothetical protein n=1 Tax=Streptomyces sp. NEAU-S7GS2 TaxID=2202000 RepID=UPI0013A53F31|nr:hypothetical protein [Streptomyces sp. NEAU-S7GS2]